MSSTIRQIAEKDIKESLRIEGKCFLAFHEELNPAIDKIVNRENVRRLIAAIL